MYIIIGIIAGVFTGIGFGGGTILIMLLSLFFNMNQHILQAINFIFFIPTAMIAIILYWRNNLIDKKNAKGIVVFGIIGAIIGVTLATKVDGKSLRKYFGVFMLLIGIYEIYSLYKNVYSKQKKT